MLCLTRFVVDSTEKVKKEAWRPKCALPRLVYYAALFFKTFMNVYVHTTYDTYDQIHSVGKKKRRSGLGMDMCRTCGLSLENGVDIWTFMRTAYVFYIVACNYLV